MEGLNSTRIEIIKQALMNIFPNESIQVNPVGDTDEDLQFTPVSFNETEQKRKNIQNIRGKSKNPASSINDACMQHKILFIAANPADTNRLNIDKEYKGIRNALQQSRRRNDFILELSLAASATDLHNELLRHTPQVVHFSGHGGNGSLIFAEQNDSKQKVTAEALAALFSLCTEYIECVVLNACYSDTVAQALCAHVPQVIGMQDQIADNVAIEFSDAFYNALFNNDCNYEQAFKHGKTRLLLHNLPGHLRPQLKTCPHL